MKKNIVIIGGTSGYGLGIAKVLKDEGHNVLVGGRHFPALEIDARYKDIVFYNIDVMNETHVRRFADNVDNHFGGLVDAIIYSAGIAIGKRPVITGVPENWHDVFLTNTLGLMKVARQMIKFLYDQQGHFINIGSIAAFTHYPGGADYCASKAAASSVMKTLRLELLGSGVRTCSIEPGLGDTNFQMNRYGGDKELAAKHYAGIKQLEPEDLGRAVSYIIGQPLHVNIDELVIKPVDQANHGVTSKNKQNF